MKSIHLPSSIIAHVNSDFSGDVILVDVPARYPVYSRVDVTIPFGDIRALYLDSRRHLILEKIENLSDDDLEEFLQS